MSETNWKEMDHKLPDGWDKYLMMLCEAGGALNELTLLSRFQKVLRLIHDEIVMAHKPPPDHYEALALARQIKIQDLEGKLAATGESEGPAEPESFDNPRLYYQEALSRTDRNYFPEIRIIYPCGASDWYILANKTWPEEHVIWCCDHPTSWESEDNDTGEKALVSMMKWDMAQGFPEAEFLGEII